jgi:transposase
VGYKALDTIRREVWNDARRAAIALLEAWLGWASRSKLPAFVKLACTVRAHKVRISPSRSQRQQWLMARSATSRSRPAT